MASRTLSSWLRALSVAVMLACLACQSNSQRDRGDETNAEPVKPGAAGTNTGILDGNGAEVRPRALIELPNRVAVLEFIDRLKGPEALWAYWLGTALDPNNKKAPTLAGTDVECFLQNAPTVPVRGYYNKITNILTFCAGYFQGDATEQLVIALHELTHVALYGLLTNLGDGEEDVVQLFESTYRKLSTAGDATAFKTGILELRALLDEHVPNLIGTLESWAVPPETVVGPVRDVQILKSGGVAFPVPAGLTDASWIEPHFLEYALNKMWTIEPRFGAKDLVARPAVDPPSLGEYEFLIAEFNVSGSIVAKNVYVGSPRDCKEIACLPKLSASVLDGNEVTDEFKAFLKSEAYGKPRVRTIGHFAPNTSGVSVRRDRVFFVQGL